jgi:hypothetical protein
MPRRFGTTTTSRPASLITRQISRIICGRFSEHSSPWTSNTRSIERSGSGSSSSCARVTAWAASSSGQCTTPWRAGINPMTRSASPRKLDSSGVA